MSTNQNIYDIYLLRIEFCIQGYTTTKSLQTMLAVETTMDSVNISLWELPTLQTRVNITDKSVKHTNA